MANNGPSLLEFKLAIESFSIDGSKHELDRLSNSIKHLERSNQELRDIIKDESDDSDTRMLMDVIGENRDVIEMQKCRISLLEQHIRDVERGNPGLQIERESQVSTDQTDDKDDNHTNGVII